MKKDKKPSYVSSGTVGKNKKLFKSIRNEQKDDILMFNRAMATWKKGGTHTPKIIQKELQVGPSTTYRDWSKPKKERNKAVEIINQ